MKYEIKAEIAEKYPVLVTLNESGVPVNLMGVDISVDVPGNGEAPPKTRKAKAATQADLAYLYKSGHPFIIEVKDAQTTNK